MELGTQGVHLPTQYLIKLASWPPPAANARPSGLKRHSRGEDAFKEGLGGLQEEQTEYTMRFTNRYFLCFKSMFSF